MFELAFDYEAIQHLTETARWGKFLAVVGFVSCGLIVLSSFLVWGLLASQLFSRVPPDAAVGTDFRAVGMMVGPMVVFLYVIFAGVIFFPCLFLYNFSTRLRKALRINDQVLLNRALKNQKILFRYMGIATIIVLSIDVIWLLFAGVALLFAGRGI